MSAKSNVRGTDIQALDARTAYAQATDPSTTDFPLVSIVTPSYNQGVFLERTILSVLRQDYPNIEYVIVDGMSTDCTKQVLRKYAKRVSKIITEPDTGQANALDKGFRACSGEILAWLNSDDCYASPRAVSDIVGHFRDNPACDIAYGRRKSIDRNGFLLRVNPYRQFSREILIESDYLPQECCFWRRDIYQRAGGYIDQSYDFAMDYELWLRFLEHGARFESVDSFVGLFRYYDESKSSNDWTQKGLPEVARLHERYRGTKVGYARMIELYRDHYAGFDRIRYLRAEALRQEIFENLIQADFKNCRLAPLDSWVFARDDS